MTAPTQENSTSRHYKFEEALFHNMPEGVPDLWPE